MKRLLFRYMSTVLDTLGIAFASVVVLLVSNGHDLLERYGLVQSSHIVKDQPKP